MATSRTFRSIQLPEHWFERVSSELADGEKLLWACQPVPARFMRDGVPCAMLGILGIALTIVLALIWDQLAPLSIILFVSLLLLSAPLWLWYRAKQTCYALTDRRAILWEPGGLWGLEQYSYKPTDLINMRCWHHADGTGDLILEEYFTYGKGGVRVKHYRGFMGVASAREVEDRVRRLLLAVPAAAQCPTCLRPVLADTEGRWPPWCPYCGGEWSTADHGQQTTLP